MVDVIRSKDCGNSPKNTFAEKIAIALELHDFAFLSEVLVPDATWELSDGDVVGIKDIERRIKANSAIPARLTIDHVVTHGKVGAVNGYTSLEGGSVSRFCHVIEFSNTKCANVRRVVSYSDL